jgi:hypothetical protein
VRAAVLEKSSRSAEADALRKTAFRIAVYVCVGAVLAVTSVLVIRRADEVAIGSSIGFAVLGINFAAQARQKQRFVENPILDGQIPVSTFFFAALLCVFMLLWIMRFTQLRHTPAENFWLAVAMLTYLCLCLFAYLVRNVLFRMASGVELGPVSRLEIELRIRPTRLIRFFRGKDRSQASRLLIECGERFEEALDVVRNRAQVHTPRLSPDGDRAVADGYLTSPTRIEDLIEVLREYGFSIRFETVEGAAYEYPALPSKSYRFSVLMKSYPASATRASKPRI